MTASRIDRHLKQTLASKGPSTHGSTFFDHSHAHQNPLFVTVTGILSFQATTIGLDEDSMLPGASFG